ncbi:hypothetical protein CPB85DRAFT_1288037 [Mucidula mucida]|nr:hypothetical protein CPB85DRAFT_1288037 [Mucidula mucida]
MFSGFPPMTQLDAELATRALKEEGDHRFPSFSASDAVTLGLSLRKRFRVTQRHETGCGLVISVQTIAGHTLFACTVGDQGHSSGRADVSLDSWACLQGMVDVVKRTGHSSFYVEKSMNAMGKTTKQMGMPAEFRVHGGAFPIWLENAPCCPIAVVACFSGSSQDDHSLVVKTVRDYITKMKNSAQSGPSMSMPTPHVVEHHMEHEWTEPGEHALPVPPSEFAESLYTSHTGR